MCIKLFVGVMGYFTSRYAIFEYHYMYLASTLIFYMYEEPSYYCCKGYVIHVIYKIVYSCTRTCGNHLIHLILNTCIFEFLIIVKIIDGSGVML